MKKLLFSLTLLAGIQLAANAQAPAKFNYQGIARNGSGAPLAAKALSLRLTIHDGSAGGTTVYQETQSVTTNAYGLFNTAIGSGTPVSGTIGGIAWGSGDKYLQVEMDELNGTAYTNLGTTQLLSVPYAMAAASAPAPALTLTGNALSAGGNTVTLPTYTAGTGINIASGVISAGSLGGDVTGAPGGNTITKLQGTSVSAAAPASGQVLQYNGSAWAPAIDTGTVGNTSAGFLPVATSAHAISNSIVYQNGTSLAIGATTGLGGTLNVYGTNTGTLYSLFKNNSTVTGSFQEVRVAAANALLSLGSAYSGSSGTDYHYARYSGGRFSIINGNDEQLTVGVNGNVGINNNAPAGLLHLSQNGRIDNNASAFGKGVVMTNGSAASNPKWYLGVGKNDGYILGSYNSANGYVPAMYVDPAGNMGIAMDTPASTMDVGGSFSLPIRTLTTGTFSYTVTSKDYTVICTAPTPLTVSIYLPSAVGIKGRMYVIKKASGSGDVTVYSSTSVPLFFLTSVSTLKAITVQSDGANWVVINQF